jgi:hypothetical protein
MNFSDPSGNTTDNHPLEFNTLSYNILTYIFISVESILGKSLCIIAFFCFYPRKSDIISSNESQFMLPCGHLNFFQ